MNSQRMRVPAIFAGVLGLALIVVACSSVNVVYGTPGQGTQAAPTPTDTATPTDTDTPTPAAPTDTLAATPSSSPKPKVTRSPSPSPSPSPTGPAGGCSGNATTQSFFVTAANHFKFAVYCAAVPKGWYFSASSSSWPGVAKMSATYTGPGGASIVIKEGAFCTTGASPCSPSTGPLGSAHFGKLSGALDATTTGFAIYVSPGTAVGYTATGTAVTQATFVSIAAALYLVPKS